MKLNKNLVLVGMMGSGKTLIGKILSKKLEFEFIDTDNKIEEFESKTISEIFKKNGEKYFRKIEEEISLKFLGFFTFFRFFLICVPKSCFLRDSENIIFRIFKHFQKPLFLLIFCANFL